VVYGITSLSQEEISDLLTKIRAYWGIENGLHYRRDFTLWEDQTRMTKVMPVGSWLVSLTLSSV
jgi:predicted transposase YbfD/YdcC